MDWKLCQSDDIPQLAALNGLLHEDEGAIPMDPQAREERLRRWLDADYCGILFTVETQTVGYALYRPADPDSEGLNPGVFVRQFFVVRDRRRQGVGRQMLQILTDQIWPAGCSVLLDTEYENSRAQAFWRALGFREHHLSFLRPGSE